MRASRPAAAGPVQELEASSRIGTIAGLSACLGVSTAELSAAAHKIPREGYDPLEIVINGKRRVIHRPRPWLKTLQRRLHDEILATLPISHVVYSRRGLGVIANARRHLARRYMVTLDLADCFPSIHVPEVRTAWRNLGMDPEATSLATRLVTYQNLLPQGPPSSPGVLDLVFAPIDEKLMALAHVRGATYTRYMDDLCFSANEPLLGLEGEVNRIVRQGGFRLNRRKIRCYGPGDQHTVTKIVVGTTLNPEPEYLEALIREIERAHRSKISRRDRRIAGMIQWVAALNPERGRSLRTMWGSDGRKVRKAA